MKLAISIKASLLLLLIFAAKTHSSPELLACSANHRRSALANFVYCQPRPRVISLNDPLFNLQNNVDKIHPNHAFIKRCGGSCWSSPYSCKPTITRNVTLLVTGNNRFGQEICSSRTVEEHLACHCSCSTRPSDCRSGQSYSNAKCMCECADIFARAHCLISGKDWDESSCTCKCPGSTWTPCSTGYYFDNQESCMCVRIQDLSLVESYSCNLFLSFVVVIFVCLILSLSAALFFLMKPRGHEKTFANDDNDCFICKECGQSFLICSED